MSDEDLAELRSLLKKALSPKAPSVYVCQGKFPHASRKAALYAQRTFEFGRVAPYHCEFCKAWHVGGHTISKGRRKRAGLRG